MINLLQQVQKVGGLGFGRCGLQFLPPDHQLVAQHVQVCNLDCHGGKLLPVTESFQWRWDSDFSRLS
jgi:hypothetical protein